MHLVTLPRTDLVVSRLGFGTASLHHLIWQRDREALLKAVLDAGFTHFDTARMYGEGAAERALGKYLGSARKRITLATKFGIQPNPLLEAAPWLMYPQRAIAKLERSFRKSAVAKPSRCLSRRCVERSLTRSLSALRTDWLDVAFVHEPTIAEVDELLEIAGFLDSQRNSGTIRYLGLAGNAAQCAEIARRTGNLFDILQVEDSVAGREADAAADSGLPAQITYGYVRLASEQGAQSSPLDTIARALTRNLHGCVLVSTRQADRVRVLASLASSAEGGNA